MAKALAGDQNTLGRSEPNSPGNTMNRIEPAVPELPSDPALSPDIIDAADSLGSRTFDKPAVRYWQEHLGSAFSESIESNESDRWDTRLSVIFFVLASLFTWIAVFVGAANIL